MIIAFLCSCIKKTDSQI